MTNQPTPRVSVEDLMELEESLTLATAKAAALLSNALQDFAAQLAARRAAK